MTSRKAQEEESAVDDNVVVRYSVLFSSRKNVKIPAKTVPHFSSNQCFVF